MDSFVSRSTNRLDAKGRVSIPAPFRAVLARDGYEGLFVNRSLIWDALDCGGNALRGKIDALLARFEPYSEEWEAHSLALNADSDTLKIDGEGRIILTEALKAFIKVKDEVTFVGQGHKFQIWEPSRFEARLVEARDKARETMRKIGPGQAAPLTSVPPPPGARD